MAAASKCLRLMSPALWLELRGLGESSPPPFIWWLKKLAGSLQQRTWVGSSVSAPPLAMSMSNTGEVTPEEAWLAELFCETDIDRCPSSCPLLSLLRMCSLKAMRLALFMERGHCVFFLWPLFMLDPAPTLLTPPPNLFLEYVFTVMEVLTDVLLWMTTPCPVDLCWNLGFGVALVELACFSLSFMRAAASSSRCCVARRLEVDTSSGAASFSSCWGVKLETREWSRRMSYGPSFTFISWVCCGWSVRVAARAVLTATTTTEGWRPEITSSWSEGRFEQVARNDWICVSDDAVALEPTACCWLGLLCEAASGGWWEDILQEGEAVPLLPSGRVSSLTEEAPGKGVVGEAA